MDETRWDELDDELAGLPEVPNNEGEYLMINDVGAAVWTAIEPVPMSFTFTSFDNEELVHIDSDGTVTFGANYQPDEAAEMFWQAMGEHSPKVMQAQIDELTAKIGLLEGEKEVLEYQFEITKEAIGVTHHVSVAPPEINVSIDPEILEQWDTITVSDESLRVRKPKKALDEEAYERAMRLIE